MSIGKLRAVQRHVGVDEYLRDEELSDQRREYVDGAVFAMTGASDRHNDLVGSLYVALRSQLRPTCRVYMIDLKLKVQLQKATSFYYPDLMVTCSERDTASHWKTEPSLLIEVLSPSTERTDRTEKLMAYTQLPSLEAYLLVAQDEIRVEAMLRANAWAPQILGPVDVISLPTLGVEITVDAVYGD
jgi:Uma2 family endonuclease